MYVGLIEKKLRVMEIENCLDMSRLREPTNPDAIDEHLFREEDENDGEGPPGWDFPVENDAPKQTSETV